MQTSMNKAANNKWRLLLSLVIIGLFISCEKSNTVGGDLIEPAAVRIDTIYVDNFTPKSVEPFSGRIGQTPIGVYEDPLFGKYESTGYYRPTLIPKTNKLSINSAFKLRLTFNKELAYGDTTKGLGVSIFPITEKWRDKTLKYKDDLVFDQSQLIGQFTYTNEDTIDVELSDSLFVDYIKFQESPDSLRDSLYNANFYGFALVPNVASTKIIYPNLEDSKIYYIRESSGDTIDIALENYAFNQKRSNIPNIPNKLYLNGNLESFYSLNFKDLTESIKGRNLLKAEFVVYEDTLQLKSSLPAGHTRPSFSFLDLKTILSSQFEYDMQFGSSDFIASKSSVKGLFSFNVTDHISNYVYGTLDGAELYLNINPNGGIIFSTIFFDSSATNALRPKLILTTVE